MQKENKTWLAAVSGGPDSMAMLDMCIRQGMPLAAAHVNYHHRPEADAEEAYVKDFCLSHGIRLFVKNDPFIYEGNFEAAARKHRYDFFAEIVKENGYAGVLVAHQEDDLIETYIMQKEKNIVPEYYGLKEEMMYHGILIRRPLLSHTKKGHNFIAVGDNYQGAELVGINPTQTKIYAYVISGVFASVAGLIFTSRIGFITPMSGNSYEMKAIAACVLGGISLSGGLGTLIGAAIGAVIMTSITRILVFLGLSSNYDNTITGIILIVIVVVNTIIQNREIVKSRREISLKRIAQKAFIDNQEVSK